MMKNWPKNFEVSDYTNTVPLVGVIEQTKISIHYKGYSN